MGGGRQKMTARLKSRARARARVTACVHTRRHSSRAGALLRASSREAREDVNLSPLADASAAWHDVTWRGEITLTVKHA